MIFNDILLYLEINVTPIFHMRDFFRQLMGEDTETHGQTLVRALDVKAFTLTNMEEGEEVLLEPER